MTLFARRGAGRIFASYLTLSIFRMKKFLMITAGKDSRVISFN